MQNNNLRNQNNFVNLNTLSPLDNRYSKDVSELRDIFSYKSWITYRVMVELEYFKHLANLVNLEIDEVNLNRFYSLYNRITDNDINDILRIELSTHHDIKAIEYWLRQKYLELDIGDTRYQEYIHFGLTSQDINSVAFSLQLRDCLNSSLKPLMIQIGTLICNAGQNWVNIPILAHTHGQPAVPTFLGKEFYVFWERLIYIYHKIEQFETNTKFGGAVGNLNAHFLAFPEINWFQEMNNFCVNLGLRRWKYTTQISNYEDIIYISHLIMEFNNVLIDLSQDIWLYVSKNYFKLNLEQGGQVGSSTMPQKVNPINFENAEGNLKIANSNLEMLTRKLPISRLQRDLTDSTVLRNFGTYIGYSIVAYKNILKGLNKLQPNIDVIMRDLESHPEILGEGVQTILRKYGVPDGYNIIKNCSQNVNFESVEHFLSIVVNHLSGLDIPQEALDEIRNITMESYCGRIDI
jgi:adenylosuccinate lyase